MIRTQELVPDYYIENSRDFQVLCRLSDFNYNSTKFNIDTMTSILDTMKVKDNILPLIGNKFGIYDKEACSNRELLKALPEALYYKGSLKAITILVNAFLDSLHVFDYVVAYHTTNEESAKEVSTLLAQTIKTYTLVIVLSTKPSFTLIRILQEYLKMVVPCGMTIKYIFGITDITLDKFKYLDDVFIYFVTDNAQSKIAKKENQYKIDKTSDIQFIKKKIENVNINTVGSEIVDKPPKEKE